MNKTFTSFEPETSTINIPSLVDYIHQTYCISYKKIAEIFGISSAYLSYLRRGIRPPTHQVTQQIIRVLSSPEFSDSGVIISTTFFATGIRGDTMSAKNVTIKEAVYNFLVSKQAEGKSDDTISFYKENLSRFAWWLQSYRHCRKIREISTQLLREFFVYVATEPNRWQFGSTSSRKPASRSTVDAYWRTIQSFFTWLVNEEVMENDVNPMRKIPRPKVTSKIIQDIPLEVIRNVLDHCGHTPFTLVRNQAIIMVFLDTGVRLGACSNITFKDISLEKGLITVREKGDKPNVIHLGETAMSYLQAYLEMRKELSNEYLWVNQEGRRMQKSAIQIMVRRLRKYGGDHRWTPHTFRNTWAINLLRGGADTFSLQVLGGWVDLDMPRRYTRAMNIEDAVRVHQKASPADRMAKL